MSDIFYDLDNQIDIRVRKAKAKELWALNPVTEEYERVLPGGGEGGAVLPYYAKANKIDFDASGSVSKTVLEQTGLDVIDIPGDKATNLSSTALTFGDSSGNVSLEKGDVQIIKDLQTGTYPNPAKDSKVLIFDSLAQKYTSTTWRDYLHTSSIQIPNPTTPYTQLLWSGIAIRNSTAEVGANISVSSQNVTLGSRESAGFTISQQKPRGVFSANAIRMYDANAAIYSDLTKTGVQIRNETGSASLNLPVLQDIVKFHAKAQAAATGDDRLVTFNPTTKDYKLVEQSSGGDLPGYLKPSEIVMTSPAPIRMNLKSYNMTFQNVTEEETGTVGVISDTSVMFGRRVTADGGISITQPQSYLSESFLTLYGAGMGTYAQLSKDRLEMRAGSEEAALTLPLLQDLERFNAKASGAETAGDRLVSYNTSTKAYKLLNTPASMAPKTYQYTIPRYTTNDPINGRSYLDRLTRADPDDNNHAYSPASTPMHLPVGNGHGEKCVINVGDSIVFKSEGPEPVFGGGYSVYFDTWYLLPFNSPAGSLTENSIFEGSIVSNSFAELPYNVSLDLRITNISTLGYCLAVRINALTITTGTIANPVITKVNHKSGFKGSFKITLVSTDITTNPALVIY